MGLRQGWWGCTCAQGGLGVAKWWEPGQTILCKGDFEGRNNEFLSLYFSEHMCFLRLFSSTLTHNYLRTKMRGTAPWFIHVRKSKYS